MLWATLAVYLKRAFMSSMRQRTIREKKFAKQLYCTT